jgi:hypothetical protein
LATRPIRLLVGFDDEVLKVFSKVGRAGDTKSHWSLPSAWGEWADMNLGYEKR